MSDASQFDPNLFLQAQTSEVNKKRPPLPTENPASPDGLYTAVIGNISTDNGLIGKGERTGEPWVSMVIPLQLEVPTQVQDQLQLKLEKGYLVFTDRVFLDLVPGSKPPALDNSVGRNRGQRNYRDALDLNKPGDVWSWQLAVGRPVKVKLTHELYNGEIVEKIGGVFRK